MDSKQLLVSAAFPLMVILSLNHLPPPFSDLVDWL